MTSRTAYTLIALLTALALFLAGAVWLTRPPQQYQMMHPLPLTAAPALWTYADLSADPSRVACPPSYAGITATLQERRGIFGYVTRADGCSGWTPLFTLTDPATGRVVE